MSGGGNDQSDRSKAAAELRAKARRARRHAADILDERAREALRSLADEFDVRAAAIEDGDDP